MEALEKLGVCLLLVALAALSFAISAAIFIFAINGLFGMELAYSAENLFYAWLIIASVSGTSQVATNRKYRK